MTDEQRPLPLGGLPAALREALRWELLTWRARWHLWRADRHCRRLDRHTAALRQIQRDAAP